MPHAVEQDTFSKPLLAAVPRSLPSPPPADPPLPEEESVIRRLAADRLRDLCDEGLTAACVGRMYGLSGAELEALSARLLPGRLR